MLESGPISSTSSNLRVLGGGPAGASAALSALREGAHVDLIEKSLLPRHKVCGEFLSPGIEMALERLGLWCGFQEQQPAVIQRMSICIGERTVEAVLPDPAFGLSRYRFDDLLYRGAVQGGANVVRDSIGEADIVCTGRKSSGARGDRLFGFKAHFTGPAANAVELFFTSGYYVGINCVEGGITNVCGLARERTLRDAGFHPDDLLFGSAAVRARLSPLRRTMDWMFTGPVAFGNRFKQTKGSVFYAGDALSFVDPFTGTGLLSAVVTGSLAGKHAAQGSTVPAYLADCRRALAAPFHVSSILRKLALTSAAETLVRLVPAEWLYRWTRPRLVA